MSSAEKDQNNNHTSFKKPRLFFTGLTMGLADLIPGVSGGTIALLFGIYDELLYTIKLLSGQVPRLVFQGRFKEAYKTIPFSFILPLGIGMLSAIFGLVQIVTYLLDNHAVFVWSLFFGLVLGTVVIVSKRVHGWNLRRLALLVAGAVITFSLLGLTTINTEATNLTFFGTGAVASLAMILPGISGSLIMVMLGQYETVINAVADRDMIKLLFFGAGVVVSLALSARLLSWLLRHYHAAALAFLIGVMLGSLRKVWPWQEEESSKVYVNSLPEVNWSLVASILLAVAGFIIVWKLEKIGVAKDHVDIDSKDFKHELKEQHD